MASSDVYGSGLNDADWLALRDAIWPFLHTADPSSVEMSTTLAAHLRDHSVVEMIRRFQATNRAEYLDEAGRLLIPTDQPFGWYNALTK
jgi:hypothetical protein